MSCNGKDGNGALNCVCSILAAIKEQQDSVQPSDDRCANDFCNVLNNNFDTIPVILVTKKNTLLYNFIDIDLAECEPTVYFRVNDVDEDTGCAQLEMLRPNAGRAITTGDECCIPLNQVCAGADLELTPTGQCFFVDCNCVCSVRCINPNTVVNNGTPAG